MFPFMLIREKLVMFLTHSDEVELKINPVKQALHIVESRQLEHPDGQNLQAPLLLSKY